MILCTDPILKEKLKSEQINAVVFDSVLTELEKQRMLESLDGFASGWFLDSEGNDYTEYRGVSIGGCLREEVMTLFHILYHFVWIINKNGDDGPFEFYQSESCKVPDVVEELIWNVGGNVKTTLHKYPYVCFRDIQNSQSRGGGSYHIFNLDISSDSITSQNVLLRFKYCLRVALSKIFFSFASQNKYIYFYYLRSLKLFYKSYLMEKYNEIGLILEQNSKKYILEDGQKINGCQNLWKLVRLNLRGVRTDISNPPLFSKVTLNRNQHGQYERLVSDFKTNFRLLPIVDLLKNSVPKTNAFFIDYFDNFYVKVLPRLIKTIDYYYKKFDKKAIAGCLEEMLHPVKAQILSNLKKRSLLIPPNHLLHNQLFCPYIISRTEPYFKVIALSNYDKTRYARLGFNKENVEIADSRYFEALRNKLLRPFKKLQILKRANVLINPPFPTTLHTFHFLYNGQDMIRYFWDIFDILEELSVSRIKIRAKPGTHKVQCNSTRHTVIDCYKYFVDFAIEKSNKSYSFNVTFSENAILDIEENVLNSDIVIGVISGLIFETLMLGRDYIVYDNSTSPFPGGKEGNLVHDGVVKRFRQKEELRKHLMNYKPTDRDQLLERYYPEIFVKKEREKCKTLDLMAQFGLRE